MAMATEAERSLVANKLAEELVTRIMALPDRKRKRVSELGELYAASQDPEEQREIVRVALEIIKPALLGISWPKGAVADLDEGVDAAAIHKVEAYRKQVGLRIKNFRKAAGLTQVQLATKAEIPQSHVCRLEKGRHAATDTTIARVAGALGVAPGQIDPAYDG